MAVAFTLAHEVSLAGTGLFSGAPGVITIGPKGTPGIDFVIRGEVVPAHVSRVVLSPMRNSVLACDAANAGSARVATIEHVLAALSGLCVWGATIRVEGPEVPILDGSAAGFVNELRCAGLKPLEREITPMVITEPLRVQDARGASILIEPREDGRDTATFVYHLDYGDGAALSPSSATWNGDPEEFARGIAPARTFCLESEANAMRAAGLFKDLTPRDMLVIGEHGPGRGAPIDNALRFEDEPARHKLLDLIGDMALLGRPFAGVVTASKSGHALSHALCRDAVRIFGSG